MHLSHSLHVDLSLSITFLILEVLTSEAESSFCQFGRNTWTFHQWWLLIIGSSYIIQKISQGMWNNRLHTVILAMVGAGRNISDKGWLWDRVSMAAKCWYWFCVANYSHTPLIQTSNNGILTFSRKQIMFPFIFFWIVILCMFEPNIYSF